MDVICERCNTEYEFDETLLSARGTSVKCTNCGHVFKVFPPGAENAERASHWRLKRSDGTTDAIDSLRELQRRISAGELTPDDEIARGDDVWKKLGSIPELETFFRAAGIEIPSPRIRSPIPPAPSRAQATARPSSAPPLRRPRQPTLLGVSPALSGRGTDPGPGPVSGPAPGPASDPGPDPGPAAASEPGLESLRDSREPSLEAPWDPSGPSLESLRDSYEPGLGPDRDSPVEGVEFLRDSLEPDEEAFSDSSGPGLESLRDSREPAYESPAWSAEGIAEAEFQDVPGAYESRGTPPPAYVDEDDDIPELPGRGWSPLSWLLLIVLVGGLALVASQWQRVAELVGMGSDPALIAASVTEGDASLSLGEPSGYDAAIDAYRRAVEAGGDQDPEIVAKLSNAYALAAQSRLDEGQSGSEVESLQAAALAYAREATALDPRNVEAKLAEADALRLASQYAAARSVLQDARSMSFSRTAEAFRVEARLSAAEAGGGLENGLESARQAVSLSPDGVRFLLLLARAEQSAGHVDRAEEALQTILAEHPNHPVATKLLAELKQAEAASAEPAAEPAPAPGSETATESESAPAPETAPETETVPATKPAPAPETPPASKGAPASATRAPPEPANTQPTPAPAPAAPARAAAPKKPAYDEYDQLSKALDNDAFVDGRPPVRDYEWQMSRGWDELAAGHYTRARAFFESALEVQPGSADAMDGLGQVSAGLEDFASAARYFRVAAERGHPDGYFELGRTYERLDKKDRAVSAYYTYIKRNPGGPHAAAARARIKTLEPLAKLPEPSSEPNAEPSKPTQESGSVLP
ncbi:MAG: tetratricopeptide repeat protein [Myxococcales bacterium]